MRFRISRHTFAIFAIFCLLTLYIILNVYCSSANVGTTVTVPNAPVSLGVEGWVLDCITWHRKRQSSKQGKGEILQEFRVNRTSLELGESPEQRRLFFHRIFAARDWPADDPSYQGLKASGPGSMLRNAQNMIAVMHSVIGYVESYLGQSEVSVLDAACGDMQWMSYILNARSDIQYTGADVVPDIITHHRRTFKRRLKNVEFIEHDIVSQALKHSYDIVVMRDVLQHLWMSDAVAALRRVSESGSKFLLVTTFPGTAVNVDVDKQSLGGGRKSSYNLEQLPFSLQSPICSSHDWEMEHVSLWKLPLMESSV